MRKPRILVAPLDWGLGHATRCIPVIYELLRQNCDVWLAGEGSQELLLKDEFPSLPLLRLPGYHVRYSRKGATALKVLTQVPRILAAIRREKTWLSEHIAKHGFDAVISDNRYGLSDPHVPSVLLSHQLRIKTPFGRMGDHWLQQKNYSYINRFSACWVPDHAGPENLAGELSHPAAMPAIPISYIGALSRLKVTGKSVIPGHILVLLSGPEPQRTILENKVIAEIAHYNHSATIVRGRPDLLSIIPSTNTIRFYNYLGSDALSAEIEKAEYVICRSGYSTLMDLAIMQKKAILVPTPGQPEQEYLARYYQEKQYAVSIGQRHFKLLPALEKAGAFHFHLPHVSNGDALEKAVSNFVSQLPPTSR